ncbi:hypothetical protein [Dactylosporangium cerinum]
MDESEESDERSSPAAWMSWTRRSSTALRFWAQGMVMVQLGGPLAEALVRIRAYARATDGR